MSFDVQLRVPPVGSFNIDLFTASGAVALAATDQSTSTETGNLVLSTPIASIDLATSTETGSLVLAVAVASSAPIATSAEVANLSTATTGTLVALASISTATSTELAALSSRPALRFVTFRLPVPSTPSVRSPVRVETSRLPVSGASDSLD